MKTVAGIAGQIFNETSAKRADFRKFAVVEISGDAHLNHLSTLHPKKQ
jgi:hypothetical protein